MAVPVAMGVFMLTLPWGWACILAGVAVWIVARWLWGRVAPGQVVAAVSVDRDGVVWVLAGQTMVTEHRKMFRAGVGSWVTRGVVLGTLLVIGGIAAGIAIGVVFFDESISYIPILVELFAGMLALATLMYNTVIKSMRARSNGHRILNARIVMPLLGLYAKRHGDDAAVEGVPADQLLAAAGDATDDELSAMATQILALQFFHQINDE